MSAVNNLRKKGTSLTLGADKLIAERVGSYPYLYLQRIQGKWCSRKCMEKVAEKLARFCRQCLAFRVFLCLVLFLLFISWLLFFNFYTLLSLKSKQTKNGVFKNM